MKPSFLQYNPRLKELARKLRRESTLSEVLLWKELKGKRMMGHDFHRQKPIDEYIVDFYCPALRLAIEVDGVDHAFNREMDKARQERLEKLGIHFLRFDDLYVKFQMEKVLETIRHWIKEHQQRPIDTPLSRRWRDIPSGRGE